MSSLNHDFYQKSFQEYGISAKGVHWHSKQTQEIRFEVLTSFIKDIKSASIIDIGCGFGDYITYLEEKKLSPDIYLGIDCENFMLEISKERFQNHTFLRCDILKDKIPQADYLVCSGALNILTKKDFLKAIANCLSSSNKGFIFNFLSTKSIHTMSVEELYTFCKTLTKKVSVSDDYLHNDATFFLEK